MPVINLSALSCHSMRSERPSISVRQNAVGDGLIGFLFKISID